jgi:hypothetical protein
MPTKVVISYPETRDAVIIPREQYEKMIEALRGFRNRDNWLRHPVCVEWLGIELPYNIAEEALKGLE